MKTSVLAFTLVITTLGASEARALCMYKGDLYAKTTVRQEFDDSKWVVRAKVMDAKDHYSEDADPYSIYHLQVERAFKGSPPKRLTFFTMRDSGGFYLDTDTGHDIGGEYLLFLNPNIRGKGDPAAIVGTVSANYSCGQSKTWREVRQSELGELERRTKK